MDSIVPSLCYMQSLIREAPPHEKRSFLTLLKGGEVKPTFKIYQKHPSYNFEDVHEELLVAAGEVSQVTVCAWVETQSHKPCHQVEFIRSGFGKDYIQSKSNPKPKS